MKELIMEQALKIAEDLDLDIDKLTPRGLAELYARAEEEVVDSFADMADMREDGDAR